MKKKNKTVSVGIEYKGYQIIPANIGNSQAFTIWDNTGDVYLGRGESVAEASQIIDLIENAESPVNKKATDRPAKKKSTKMGIHVRVLPPGMLSWYWYKRNKDGKYIVQSKGKGRQFSWLDVGDLSTPGLQGLAFLVGFPVSKVKIKAGKEIPASKFRVQKLWIEKAVLGLPVKYTTKQLELAIKKKYKSDIINGLQREKKATITNFNITTKGKDYQINLITR